MIQTAWPDQDRWIRTLGARATGEMSPQRKRLLQRAAGVGPQ
jgi:hypothetical protein